MILNIYNNQTIPTFKPIMDCILYCIVTYNADIVIFTAGKVIYNADLLIDTAYRVIYNAYHLLEI